MADIRMRLTPDVSQAQRAAPPCAANLGSRHLERTCLIEVPEGLGFIQPRLDELQHTYGQLPVEMGPIPGFERTDLAEVPMTPTMRASIPR